MNWLVAIPEIVLSIAALVVLIVGAYAPRRSAFLLSSMLSLGALLITAGLVLIAPQGIGYGGLFVADAFSRFSQVLIMAGAALAVILSLDFNRQEEGLARFEFPVLILFATVGMMIMVAATNFMTLYLGLELQSLALYVIAAFARDSLRSSEAGLKYFVLGLARLGPAALWRFADLWLLGQPGFRPGGAGVALRHALRRARHRHGLRALAAWSSRWRRCRSICGRRMSTRARRVR